MRDFDFIHSAEDVPEVLGLASDLGLILRRDQPSPKPAPDILDRAAIPEIAAGAFMAFLPDWVFGPPQYNLIEAGHWKGLYSQWPNTNCVNLTLYFRNESRAGRSTRLGSGSLGRDIRWYRPEDHSVHLAPPEVRDMFCRIRREIDTGKYIQVCGRRHAILRGALRKILRKSWRPPFDFMDEEPIRG